MYKPWYLTLRFFFEYNKSCKSNEVRKEICTSQPCLLRRDNKQLTATRNAAFLEKNKTFNFVTMQLALAGHCKRGALDFINLSLTPVPS